MNFDDHTLVNKCLSGDKKAFEQLVRRYSPCVFHIIHRFFNDKFLVADIAQEVFIKAYTSLKTYRQKSPFENWLLKITIHICYRQLQIQRKHRKTLQSDISSEDCALLDGFCFPSHHVNTVNQEQRALYRDIVEKILQKLSPKEKMVLILTEVDGMTTQEVSQLMGLSPVNIKVVKFRAKRHALKVLKTLSKISQQREAIS